MKALTIWQPWASLIMIGAKPFEFRRWDYRTRDRSLEGQRIAIHAGARRIRPDEVQELLLQLWAEGDGTGLHHEPARAFLVKLGLKEGDGGLQLPHSHVLGTAVLGKPRKASEIFGRGRGDSDRVDEQVWAWPLTELRPLLPPIPMRGAQGFWNCAIKEAA